MCHLKSATIVHHNIITWIYMFACQLNIRVEQNCFLFCDFLTYCRVDDLTGFSVPTNNRKKKTHWPSDNCSKVCVSNFDHRNLTITRLQSFGEHPYLWKKYTLLNGKDLEGITICDLTITLLQSFGRLDNLICGENISLMEIFWRNCYLWPYNNLTSKFW